MRRLEQGLRLMSKANRFTWPAIIAVAAVSMVFLISSSGVEHEFAGDCVAAAAPTPASTRPRTVMEQPLALPGLGPGASLHGKRLFPPDNPWNQDISNSPLDPNSANLIKSIGFDD